MDMRDLRDKNGAWATSPFASCMGLKDEREVLLSEIGLEGISSELLLNEAMIIMLEYDTGISKTMIGRIVTEDFKLKKTPAKFIPRFLTNEQKLCRLATCEDMLEMTRLDPEWKDKLITGDETWVKEFETRTWNATVNKDLYIAQLHRVNEAIQQKIPDRQVQIILLHDNAMPHVAQVVKAVLQELEWEVLQHPPYSPDLAPTDYHLFRSMSNHMRGTTFDDEEDLKTWLNNFFDTRRWEEVAMIIMHRFHEVRV
ncbi:hypothetical protein LAZ67_19002237 [Cordylochernes scorpioides]|uniref:Tc1-like transposase DDE domain-containing protein n=1 Tax=Cordylochernes scorpioides TaxID=51811 RepID=A0ABY6LMK9_9ARAC|nr:hypothetical protein LAZ67_19002237 [Cordylochernes scorpioides]